MFFSYLPQKMKNKFLRNTLGINFDHLLLIHFNSFIEIFYFHDSYAYYNNVTKNEAQNFDLGSQTLAILKVAKNYELQSFDGGNFYFSFPNVIF
jgi:hypothetical protein